MSGRRLGSLRSDSHSECHSGDRSEILGRGMIVDAWVARTCVKLLGLLQPPHSEDQDRRMSCGNNHHRGTSAVVGERIHCLDERSARATE